MNATQAAALITGVVLAGCTGQQPRIPALNHPLFAYDYKQVSELVISKNDPESGQNWTARLKTEGPAGSWMVTSAPDGLTLSDRNADSNFIDHLLDTVRTLESTAEAPRGPLSSFQLDPPRFAVRLGTPSGLKEVLIGADAPGGGAYAKLPDSGVFVMQGAALKMLGYLTSFDVLRHRVLLNFAMDDMDEIEIAAHGKKVLHAERAGDDWVDLRTKKRRAGLPDLVQALEHLRIKRFLDQETARTPLKGDYRLVFKDRHNQATELSISTSGESVLAEITSRKGASFELYPETRVLLARGLKAITN